MEATQVLNAKEAIARHVGWKMVLQFAVAMQEQLTPTQIDQIHYAQRCPIGRWLSSPATMKLQNDPAHRDLLARHLRFHKEMSTIAQMIADGQFSNAARALKADSHFAQAGNALALAITTFDGVLKIAVPIPTMAPTSHYSSAVRPY